MAAAPAIAIGLGLVGGGLAAGLGKKKPKTPALPEAPAPPDPLAGVNAIAETLTRMRLTQRSSTGANTHGGTLLTGPSGLATPAPVTHKTLLGQ